MKKIHFIAIGGSVMHNLALALKSDGYEVTGSDDVIREPARGRLVASGLLPESEGWFPERITPEIDAVILGMHANAENPELLKAQSLNIPVYSFPEFIYEQSRNKQRIVIAGSHGKTTVTAMVLHVLKALNYDFDYLVGAQINGFEKMVRLSDEAPVLIVEGDEYLASPLDPRPKFLLYKPHIVAITGIAWDHVNVFKTEEIYVEQFANLLNHLPKAGMCIFNKEDKILRELVLKNLIKEYHYQFPYVTPLYRVRKEQAFIKLEGVRFPVQLIGKHNAANVAAAWEICKLLSVEKAEFISHIQTFKGAGMRLEKIYEDEEVVVIRDFAHAPSKVNASVEAVLQFYKHCNVIACLELHTFSSLNKSFISRYRNTLKKVRNKIVMVSSQSLTRKKLPIINSVDIQKAFNDKNILFAQSAKELYEYIRSRRKGRSVVLLMSSGDFEGFDFINLFKLK